MGNHNVVVRCWNCGHTISFNMTIRQEENLVRKIRNNKVSCPVCTNGSKGTQYVFIEAGHSVMNLGKLYQCKHGHISAIAAFVGGPLNIQFGNGAEMFVNVDGTIEELSELIDKKEISCHHVSGGDITCDCKLLPVDDTILSYPSSPGFKVRTRIGDVWDKHGIEPVRNGHYTNDDYQATRSEKANRERLSKIRERNVPLDRIPGQRIDKPTDRQYSRRTKQEIKPDRLNGPK